MAGQALVSFSTVAESAAMSEAADDATSNAVVQPDHDQEATVSTTGQSSSASYTIEWFVKARHEGTQTTTMTTASLGHRLSWRVLFDWNHNNSGNASLVLELTDACCVKAPISFNGTVRVADLPNYQTYGAWGAQTMSTDVNISGQVSMDRAQIRVAWFNSNVLGQTLANKTEIRLVLTASISMQHEAIQPANFGLKPFFNSDLLSDVRIVAGCKTFNAHKLVLAARSSVFRAMFNAPGDGVQNYTVELSDDVSGDVFGHFLRFLYSDELDHAALASAGVATGLFVLSDKYKIEALKRRTSTWLCQRLNEDSVLLVAHLAVTHECNELRDTCVVYIVRNMETVSARDEWQTFVQQHPALISSVMVKMHQAAKMYNQNYYTALEKT